MLKDLSLIICSYNTPLMLELCLKSFVFHHGNGPHKVVIIENSTNPETQYFLGTNNIPYLKNYGGTHSASVDLGLHLVKTRYALLIDTDIIFNKSIDSVFYFFKRYSLTLLGELQGDRGGFLLYPRVAPYFCLINIEDIHTFKINFHDEEKITSTHSGDFFKNVPINYQQKNQRFYDVGSTFYEQVKKYNLGIANLEEIQSIVFHAESLSWALQCGSEEYLQLGKQRTNSFYDMAKQYTNVTIKDCFQGSA